MEANKNRENRYRGVIVLSTIAALIHGAQWGILFWKLPPTNETLFLHYNIYFGVDFTGEWKQLLWIPISGAVFLVVNSTVCFLFPRLQSTIQKTVLAMTIVLQLILFSALALIIYSNRI